MRVELSSRAVASHLCRFRKQSGGLFSGKAVAGLPGQGPNVECFSLRVPVLPSSASDCSCIKQKAVSFETASSCARRVIFPGRRQPSIVTVNELNYCVRNGNRCTLITIDTHLLFFSGKEKLSKRKAISLRAAQMFHELPLKKAISLRVYKRLCLLLFPYRENIKFSIIPRSNHSSNEI